MPGIARRRVLLLPVLFHPEPWNGIMEHLRLLVKHADPARFEFLITVRECDGEQTPNLAARAGIQAVRAPDTLSVRGVRRLCEEARADLVHVHASTTGGLPRVLTGIALARLPAIVTYHLVQPSGIPWRSRVINRATHTLASRRITAVSEGVAGSLAANAGLRRQAISVIPNGIDDWAGVRNPRSASEDVVRIGYFGRLSEEKCVHDVIEAVVIARRDAAVELDIYGDGYMREALERLVRDRAAASYVRFFGFTADVRSAMRGVDIVALASRLEGLPTALIEAMDAGLPVVATDIPGTRELVAEGVTGLLSPRGDPGRMAAHISSLAGDAGRRAAMGAAGRARYERLYRADSMVARITSVYGSI